MKIITGLGNPGAKYENNRHNVGFMMVDAMHRNYNFNAWQTKYKSLISESTINNQKVILQKPQNSMNVSGEAVQELANFYKISTLDINVIYDDIDLQPGDIRYKTGGGDGGHRGIRSIVQHLDKAFHRIRIGVGRPDDKNEVLNWVLGNFAKSDYDWLDPLINKVTENANMLISDNHADFIKTIKESEKS